MGSFKTFFSRFEPPWEMLPAGSVTLSPRNPTWNDFGKQVLATINIKDLDSRCLELKGFVVILSGNSESPVRRSFDEWVLELSNHTNEQLIAADFQEIAFLTLLDDDKTYRQLAEWSKSREDRTGILLAINDINFARVSVNIASKLVNQVVEDETFTLGVLRRSSAYRAFAKGARYVSKDVQPWIQDARLDVSVDVKLKGFEAPHVTTFTFTGEPRLVSDRVQVLIGKNGTGKSQLLNQLIGSLALSADNSGTNVFIDRSNESFIATSAAWQAVPNAVLVFSTDNEDVFPRATRLDTPLDYWYFSLASQASEELPLEIGTLPLGRALLDLIRDESELLGKNRFEIFRDIVDPVLPLSLIHLPLKNSPKKVSGAVVDERGQCWLPLRKIPLGEQALLHVAAAVDTKRDLALIDSDLRTFPPSSGQRVYLRFATLALSVISQGSAIILDEPETHLHPNFISEFMNLLHDLLVATNSIALVATHSPYVVREVPTACVHVVRREGNVPSMGSVHLKTLGASVSSISDAVFGDAAATKWHRIVAEKMSREGKKISSNEAKQVAWLLDAFGEELNSEMLSTVRYLMSRDDTKEDSGGADA